MVGFLSVLIVIVGFAVLFFAAVKFEKNKHDETALRVRPIGVMLGIIVVVGAFILAGSLGQVSAGYRGVVLSFGAVTQETKGEGLYFVTPLVNTVELMDVQTHAYEAVAGAASKDLQDVHTKVTLNYTLDPAKVNMVYQSLRRDYIERIIKPAVQESVKAITANFDAGDLIKERPKVKSAIEFALKDRLALHGIISETISMTDFQFSKAFMDAIEAKQVAVQRAQEAENKLKQIEWEAKQVKAAAEGQRNAAIAVAEGQKESAILRAQGEANATVTVADAQAKANKVLADSLRNQPELLKYVLYQKLGDDIKVIILPSGQEFILGSDVLGK